jgi:hypothetical protein
MVSLSQGTVMAARLYRYVGPEDIRRRSEGKAAGDIVESQQSLRDWARRTRQVSNGEGLIRSTYVVVEHGQLRVADYGSEHVACALGGRVMAAGVAWFAITAWAVSIERIDNQSTGYCPEPTCWPAVRAALDVADIRHPGQFTTELLFRLCPACGQRNVVKDEWYQCAVCDAELPLLWNFDPAARAEP